MSIEFERRAIEATGIAQEQLQCPVSFHPGRDADAPFEIVRLYLEAGGKPDKCVMSHLDRKSIRHTKTDRVKDLILIPHRNNSRLYKTAGVRRVRCVLSVRFIRNGMFTLSIESNILYAVRLSTNRKHHQIVEGRLYRSFIDIA